MRKEPWGALSWGVRTYENVFLPAGVLIYQAVARPAVSGEWAQKRRCTDTPPFSKMNPPTHGLAEARAAVNNEAPAPNEGARLAVYDYRARRTRVCTGF